ncbi:VOC family protein [Bacillaceae bacterium W0354]
MIFFDHLVIFSNDPKRHQELFSSVYGQMGTKGGTHDNWGTFNHLAFMKNDCYIEWLGIDDDEKASQSDNPLIQQAHFAKTNRMEGPIQFALRVGDIKAYQQHMEELNIPYDGPFPGKRTKPDGTILEWSMLFPRYEIGEETPFPFLIEWSGEGNKPSNLDDINDKVFQSITLLTPKVESFIEKFNQILKTDGRKLSELEYEYELTNGKMIIKQGDTSIQAQFEQIIFKKI